ncbi:hypothetical protein SAMD00019534_106240 [Acytostelium subglobosum LB1]|uniref:hypothetical protein n=1 Tax=Acytostelium subglobosum LB1 TaxID=1410327 RepID=UPI000644DB11|nr:hypothetical protein SAMD00019534_106240 [Acytostelium subglobosum LB1]GAM27448.1 hypothetical protein SAMD00019534_106240 [Acytostelium subglobosum LB1]|eukprot:XP_012749513.1 hypothetical protein SAMD00019534_106240 [Acytostelium subglobosum LB1]
MVLVEFEDRIVSDFRPLLHVWNPSTKSPGSNELVTTIYCNLPFELPPTESNGPMFADNTYSAGIPANFVMPGMQVTFENDHKKSTTPVEPLVGMASSAILWNLPFYLFGANDTNSYPFSQIKDESKNKLFIYQQWPVSSLTTANHAMGIVSLDTIVQHVNGYEARKVTNLDEITNNDGFGIMATVLGFLSRIFDANGDGSQNKVIWSPLMSINKHGEYGTVDGGLGGGRRATGDISNGLIIHEVGHAQGLPHAGEAFNNGAFPYVRGSLNGSVWGFNFDTNEFLSIYIPSNSSDYDDCKDDGNIMRDDRCVRQDPMQGGSGDQAKGYPYTMFSDFNAGKIQQFYEGAPIWVPETQSYIKWDDVNLVNVPYPIVNTSYGLYVDGQPQSSHRPTDEKQLSPINTGDIDWYCKQSGCDFTLRVTYKDGSKYIKLLQVGVRKWFDQNGEVDPDCLDPKDNDSTFTIIENIPADLQVTLVELLWTPYGFRTILASDAKVLVSQSF